MLGRIGGFVILAAPNKLLTFPSWLQEAPQLETVRPLISDPSPMCSLVCDDFDEPFGPRCH